jgi:hypothetical protein
MMSGKITITLHHQVHLTAVSVDFISTSTTRDIGPGLAATT